MVASLPHYDYTIVGDGSAGYVLANPLSARSSNRGLLCEAGRDLPPRQEPADMLDAYPGHAYLNKAYIWADLCIHTEVIPHNRGADAPPQLRAYHQARIHWRRLKSTVFPACPSSMLRYFRSSPG